jgi:hypothetical protein
VPTTTPTTTTTKAPTTTTLPGGPCGAVPLSPPGFASIECRLGLLLADVNGASGLGTYQTKLAKNVATAQGRLADGAGLCRESNVKKTKKRLQQAGKAMTQFTHRLNGNAARKKLDGTLRQSLVDAATAIGSDLKTFRGVIACPQDAPAG